MGNNAANVTAGKPKIGGAIYVAPLSADLPESVFDELTGFTCLGYVSDAGVANDNSPTSQSIKAWGGDTVLNLQTDRPDTFKLTLLETMEIEVKKIVYGDSNVSESEEGEIIVKATAEELEGHAFVIDMALKDGARQRIVIPEGRISALDTITYADNSAVGYGITINDIPDENGVYHYEYLASAEVSG